jgi:zinc protease
MKKIRVFWLILLLTLSVFSRNTLAVEPLKIGPDGYGKTTLPNGITVLVNEDKTTSLSSARILVGGGVLTETAANNGTGNLMIRMLLKGNSAMNAEQITAQLDFFGASVSANCYRDFTDISFTSLTENFDKVLEIISNSLTTPTFSAEELSKLKSEVEGEIKASNDDQSTVSSMLFWKTAYGNEGYGLPLLGTLESIARPTVEDLRQHCQKYVGGSNMVVAVATDLPVEQLMTTLEKRLGKIKPAADKIPAPTLKRETSRTGFISFDRNQSYIFMGFVLDRQQPRELACINLLNQVMGANVGSRLWDLRQKEKLAYDVYTHWGASGHATIFRAAIGTDTSKVKQALASLDREWTKLLSSGITEDELADAKVNMKNSLIYGIDRKAGRAGNMAFYEYIGYGYRFILDQIAMADQITLAQVNDFIKTKLAADRIYTSIVGKK